MRWNRPAHALAIAIIGLTTVNCSSDDGGNAPAPVATTLALVSGNAQTGTAGAALANPIIVKVTDQNGAAMANVAVAFAVTAGGGSVGAASVATNSQGQASTTWTLGATAGANGATATVTGLTGSPAAFTATGTAGSATQVVITAGNTQTGEVATAVAQAPTVTIRDANGNPVAGVTVTWAVTAGGGSVSAGTSMTNAQGEASIAWTLGPLVGAGLQSLGASIPGGASGTFTASGVLTAGTLAINGGDNQSAFVGGALPTAPSVLVKTPGGSGVPVQGVTVNWSVTAGGGTTSAATSVTNAAGIASIGWTIGTTVGSNNQGLSASVAGLTGSPAAFVASATVLPTQLVVTGGSGSTQQGTAGEALPQLLSVKVLDASDAPVEGVTVNWQVIAGGGSLGSATSITDAGGDASTSLTAGTAAGVDNQTVRASVAGTAIPPVDFTFTVVAAAASKIAVSSGNMQTGVVGMPLPQPIVVVVRDQYDNPVPNVTVGWQADPCCGSIVSNGPLTNASGLASASWTIGASAGVGNQTATAMAPGLAGSPIQLTASATAGAAAVLEITSGDNQAAAAGSPLPAPLVVRVGDMYNNPVSGVTVTWSAATGGGTVSAPTSTTNASGNASINRTLGGTVGAQTTTASVTGTTPAMVTFNATANPVPSSYSITLRYISAISAPRQAVFDAAAAKWSTIITGDVPDVAMNIAAGSCGANSPALNETVDDVLIFVTVDSIDGPGTILGSAGPCYIRTSNSRFSIVGRMTFDSADVANLETAGLLPATILHEMGHVLGIGTLWNVPIASPPPPLLIGAGTADPYFIGTTAIAQFNSLGGSTYVGNKVPVENMGGPGTRDGHWRETIMGKELMTGYISLIANPLSAITVGSLADAGYVVSYANADAYVVDGTNLMAAEAGSFKLNEAPPDWTIKSVDASGRIVRER